MMLLASAQTRLLSIAVLTFLTMGTSGCARTPAAKASPGSSPAIPRVEVVVPERRTIRRTTEQPGQVETFETTSIHAKVSGYIQEWTVDIGTKVRRGKVLAVISVPELDA